MHVARHPSRQRGSIQSVHLALTSAHSAGITDPVLMLTKPHSVTFAQKSSISLCQEGYSQQHSRRPTLGKGAGRPAQEDVSAQHKVFCLLYFYFLPAKYSGFIYSLRNTVYASYESSKIGSQNSLALQKTKVVQTKLPKPERGLFCHSFHLLLGQLF